MTFHQLLRTIDDLDDAHLRQIEQTVTARRALLQCEDSMVYGVVWTRPNGVERYRVMHPGYILCPSEYDEDQDAFARIPNEEDRWNSPEQGQQDHWLFLTPSYHAAWVIMADARERHKETFCVFQIPKTEAVKLPCYFIQGYDQKPEYLTS